ncbi:MAG: hypothetical protein WAX66_00975 [Patescibacteria group bacterium]
MAKTPEKEREMSADLGPCVGKTNLKHVHVGDKLVLSNNVVTALIEVVAIEPIINVRYRVIEYISGDKNALDFRTTLNWTDPAFLYFLPETPSP